MGRTGKKILIKTLMMIAMTGNHIAIIFGNLKEPHWRLLLGIGYSVAFVMCYYLAEGYQYTSSRKRYCLRLGIFAVLSQYPYYMAFRGTGLINRWTLNMMFTLLVSFLLLMAGTQFRGREFLPALTAALILVTIISDWPLLGPVMTLLFARGREEGEPFRYFGWCFASFLATVLLSNSLEFSSVLQYILFSCIDLTGPLLAWGLLRWYEKEEGNLKGTKPALPGTFLLQRGKWIFYLYYPVHLAILAFLHTR